MSAADWLFHGGAIHPGAPGQAATAGALAVTGNRIAALGEEAIALRGPRTEVVDLAGGALLPGFQDAHIHAIIGGGPATRLRSRWRTPYSGLPESHQGLF